MKRSIIILILLLFCSVAHPSTRSRIIDWICGQELNRTQIESLTWPQLESMAENRGIDPNTIKAYRSTIKNAVMSDLRVREIEAVRVGIETPLLQYNPNIHTLYSGYAQSTVDPNFVVVVYRVEIPIGAVH